MKRVLGGVLLAAVLVGSTLVPATAAVDAETVKSKNVKPLDRDKYVGGTELASNGKVLITGSMAGETRRNEHPENGGMRIYDTPGGKLDRKAFLQCPGQDNDVEFLNKKIALLGFSANKCAPATPNGFVTVDLKNPSKPRIVGAVTTGKNHTMKPIPGTPYVYTAGGGLSGGSNAGPAIVDVSNPSKPEVVKVAKTYTMDCHDISFWTSKDRERRLAFCAGAIGTGEVQIFDAMDPLEPEFLGRIVNPAIQYSHYAVANHDGTILAIDDEAFAAHECHSGQSPTGRVWFYDISNPTVPIPAGSFAPPRGGRETAGIGNYAGWVDSWCLSHGLDWHPTTNNIAVTWFTGGWSVIDANNPLQPKEAAYFQAPEDSATYSALWHRGNLYTNDMHRGVEGFKISGLK